MPRPLFKAQVHEGVSSLRLHYAPNLDGSRFLVHRRGQNGPPPSITVVLNGMTALQR